MKAADINRLLLNRFPERLDEYLSIKRLWGGEEPGPHVVYGDILVPLLQTVLNNGRPREIARLHGFLEELASNQHGDVQDLLVTSVLEPFVGSPGQDRLRDLMGPQTKQLWQRLVQDWDDAGR